MSNLSAVLYKFSPNFKNCRKKNNKTHNVTCTETLLNKNPRLPERIELRWVVEGPGSWGGVGRTAHAGRGSSSVPIVPAKAFLTVEDTPTLPPGGGGDSKQRPVSCHGPTTVPHQWVCNGSCEFVNTS